jgi:hypothetical protein
VGDVPNIRRDVFSCTNKGSLAKQGNKSYYSGCKKKIFELSGKIIVAEKQTGGLCEGLKTVGDGNAHFITNELQQQYDQSATGSVGCPCAGVVAPIAANTGVVKPADVKPAVITPSAPATTTTTTKTCNCGSSGQTAAKPTPLVYTKSPFYASKSVNRGENESPFQGIE